MKAIGGPVVLGIEPLAKSVGVGDALGGKPSVLGKFAEVGEKIEHDVAFFADATGVTGVTEIGEVEDFARGLEFGTTGLHQPGPVLVEKGKIFDQKIFRFIDADETQVFSYANFLMEIPKNFAGVAAIDYTGDTLVIREDGGHYRTLTMDVGTLFPAD